MGHKPHSHRHTEQIIPLGQVPARIIESKGQFLRPHRNLVEVPRVHKIPTHQQQVKCLTSALGLKSSFFSPAKPNSRTNLPFLGPPPTAAPRVNNNISSNFKRQNTVDTATIKENTPRYSGSRPATATAASTKTPSSSGMFFAANELRSAHSCLKGEKT